MTRKQHTFKSDDGVDITYYKWNDLEERTKAIVVILHGMAEHATRYEEFADYLNTKGYIVYGCDHRGHGQTGAQMGIQGSFGEGGWQRVVKDIYQLTNIVEDNNEGIPIIMLGHSMGSLLARASIIQFGNRFKGVILSGTTNGVNYFNRNIGLLLSNIIVMLYGKEKRSKMLDKAFFGNNNKAFTKDADKFAWLSRDKNKVQMYNDDKLCGFICTAEFFVELMGGIKSVVSKQDLNRIFKDLPILILSGEKDPVGSNGKDVIKTFQALKRSGIKDIQLKLYKNGRHEMLNEINRIEVYRDISSWIDKIIEK